MKSVPKPTPHIAPMPDRSAAVRVLCAQHPEAFPQDETNDASRLAFLQGTIIPTLNKTDNGNWGYMTKTDQGNKVPCDIMMWRPTNDVVDCMTGTGGAWIPHDPPPDAWVWTAVGGSAPTPIPPQPPSQNIPYDENRSIAFGLACNDAYVQSGAPIDPGMIAVHAERDAYDFYVNRMADPACHNKHVNEFRAVYHLPPL